MKQIVNLSILFLLTGVLIMSCESTHEIKTIQLPVASDPTVAFRIWVKVGSQNDPVGKEGLAAITADMIAEASTRINIYEQILEKLYPMAASYNAQIDKEMTMFIGRCHKDNLQDFSQLLTEALIAPAFTDEDFNRIKSNCMNYLERTIRYSDDEEFGKEALSQFIFAGTHYEHLEEGYIESMKSITLDDIKSFYQKFYTRDNIVIGIGGGYDKQFVSDFTKELAKLPAGLVEKVTKPTPPPINGLEALLIEKTTGSTAISFGFPFNLVRSNDKEFYAMWLANSWLGQHRNSSSHLFQVIREARGMNYGDYSYIEHFPWGGRRMLPPANVARSQQMFQVWIRPVQNHARHFALRAAVRELDKLIRNGMSREDLELTRKFLSNYYLNYAQTTSDRLGYKIDDSFYGLKPGFLADFPEKLNSITLEDVNKTIKKYLQTDNMKIVMITQETEALKNDLINNTVSPMKYDMPKPQEILDEDKEIEKYHLTFDPQKITIKNVDQMFVGALK
jgi:zinc protease